jgi:hypothetical protein
MDVNQREEHTQSQRERDRDREINRKCTRRDRE